MQRDQVPSARLDEQACRALLGSVRLGRVALSERALPMILPVPFACLDRDVVFQVSEPALVRAAHDKHVVCFEADHARADAATDGVPVIAWTVAVVGQLSVITEPVDLERCRALPELNSPGPSAEFIRMSPEVFQGRLGPL
jgi:uncharacterized protein